MGRPFTQKPEAIGWRDAGGGGAAAMMVAHNSQARGPLSLDSGRIAVLARYLLSDSCILLVEWLFLDIQRTREPCTRSSFTWFGVRSKRRPVLVKAVEKRLRELLAEKAAELQTTIVALEVMPDHFTCLLRPTRVGRFLN
jgi:hypothetical protein